MSFIVLSDINSDSAVAGSGAAAASLLQINNNAKLNNPNFSVYGIQNKSANMLSESQVVLMAMPDRYFANGTVNSKEKAFEGAYCAWLAEHRARRLHAHTAYNIATGTLFDPKLPQVTLSHEAFLIESSKAPSVEENPVNPLFTTAPSPFSASNNLAAVTSTRYYREGQECLSVTSEGGNYRGIERAVPYKTSYLREVFPTYNGSPASPEESSFFDYIKQSIRHISFRPSHKTVMSSGGAAPFASGTVADATLMGFLPVRSSKLSIEEALLLSDLLTEFTTTTTTTHSTASNGTSTAVEASGNTSLIDLSEDSVIIESPRYDVRFLDLSEALDTQQEPPQRPTEERLSAVRSQYLSIYGEKETEKGAERLQKEVERLKGEYVGYQEGIDFLVNKRLDPINILTDALVKNRSLVELRLARNNLGAPDEIHHEGRASYQALNRFTKFFDLNEGIKILDLSGNRAGPRGVGIIAKALCKNISVHTLDLSGNDVMVDNPPEEEPDPEFVEDDPVFGELYLGLEAISELVKKNKFLRCLSLRNNLIKPEREAVETEEDETEAIEGASDTPIMRFFEPFKKYHKLRLLDLSSNELGDFGVLLLCHCLKESKSIRYIDLSNNRVGPKGLGYLGSLIKDSEYCIETVVAKSNEFAGKRNSKRSAKRALASAKSFALALKLNKTLRVLNLSCNHFGPLMSEVLLHTLPEVYNLRELYFDNNDMCGLSAIPFSPDKAIEKVPKPSPGALNDGQNTGAIGSGKAEVSSEGPSTSSTFSGQKKPSTAAAADSGRVELFDDKALRHICDAVGNPNSKLRVLSIGGNYIQYKGIRTMVSVAAAADSLKAENAQQGISQHESFAEEGAGGLSDTGGGNRRRSNFYQRLVSLNLSWNFLDDDALIDLCTDILPNTNVKNLNLSHNRITSTFPLAKLCRRQGGLGSVADLSGSSGNTCDSSGFGGKVVEGVSNIDISYNNIGATSVEGFTAFIDAISLRPVVKRLNVSYNNLEETHVAPLIFLCRTATQPFEELMVEGNPRIGFNAILSMMNSLKNNKSIKSLRLSAPAFGQKDVVESQSLVIKAILEMLQTNDTITDVNCGFQMSVAFEPEIRKIQQLLLLNALKLPRPRSWFVSNPTILLEPVSIPGLNENGHEKNNCRESFSSSSSLDAPEKREAPY